jgi:hypothetical protein
VNPEENDLKTRPSRAMFVPVGAGLLVALAVVAFILYPDPSTHAASATTDTGTQSLPKRLSG